MTRPVRLAIVIGAAALIGVAAVGGWSLLGTQTADTHTAEVSAHGTVSDMRGDLVLPDPGSTPSPAQVKAMNVQPMPGVRFHVPSVGLNVPLSELSTVDGSITPPGYTSAYLVRNLGGTLASPSSGTVYVVMHSVRGGGRGPGNYLTDVGAGTAALGSGAMITVGDVHYTVTGSTAVAKTALPHDDAIWTDTPGRLVVITCLQQPDGAPSVDNMVITATLS